ncbi:MAG: 50S ribosomal protein L23 [Flavobacteriales bacterium]
MKKNIIKKPVVTEKMTAQGEELNKYGFLVHEKANKIEVKNAVEKQYGVSVKKVNLMNYMGKSKTRYTQAGIINGKENDYKKAVVSVEEGDTIDVFSSI